MFPTLVPAPPSALALRPCGRKRERALELEGCQAGGARRRDRASKAGGMSWKPEVRTGCRQDRTVPGHLGFLLGCGAHSPGEGQGFCLSAVCVENPSTAEVSPERWGTLGKPTQALALGASETLVRK